MRDPRHDERVTLAKVYAEMISTQEIRSTEIAMHGFVGINDLNTADFWLDYQEHFELPKDVL